MAERNVYGDAERRMLEAEAERFAGMEGWYRPARVLAATEESVRRMGLGVDPWNPLWHDASYARDTRWGKIVAYPTFVGFFGETGILGLRAPAECGRQYMIWMGEDYELERPLLAGESFQVYQHRPQIFDVTPDGAASPRVYGLLEGDLEYFDAKEQPLGRLKNYVQRMFQPEPPPIHAMPEYSYTKEEIEHLGHLMREEQVRGSAVRYWEDVQAGDEPKPIVTGPTTMGSNSLVSAITPDLGDFFMHTRHFFLDSLGDPLGPEFIPDPAGRRYLIRGGPMGRHYSDLAAQAEGEPCAWLFGVVSRFSLLRVLTNWMGDDAVLRRFCWRHMTRTRVGDAMIGQGRVVGKRVENGEHLADMHVWLRNLRGNVSEAAVATVCLPCRGADAAEPASLPQTDGAAAGFEVGERVRIKARPDWPTPPGFRLAGAEGTVAKWVHYDDAMADFADVVVCVHIDRAQGEGEPYAGSSLLFRPDDLEHA